MEILNKELKARRFDRAEYGFNYFCILNPNYKIIEIDEVVVYNGIKCFELNSLCYVIERLLAETKDINISRIKSFERIDGRFRFYDTSFNDITDIVPESIVRSIILPTNNMPFRHRYIIGENMVVIRRGLLKFNNKEYDISDDYIMTNDAFEKKYGSLPCRNYSFNGSFQ